MNSDKKNTYPENALVLAPLSGFTDLPFRMSARRHGCRYMFTEMVDISSLVYGRKKTLRLMDRGDYEDWLGIQLIGADEEILIRAVEIINGYKFDVLDFNLGCPAPKVAKKGKGAGLARNIEKSAKLVQLIVKYSDIPVTAKIRILDERNPEPTILLVQSLEAAGITAVTIHGRVLSAFYSGPVFYDIISAVRESVKTQIIVNGGIKDYASYVNAKEKSGCNVVMLARGALGNPWIFEEIESEGKFPHITISELKDELIIHICEICSYYGEYLGCKIARKLILAYMKGRGFSRKLKNYVSKISSLSDFLLFVENLR